MRNTKTANTSRKLEDTSWLAQSIKDKMDVEFDRNTNSEYWFCLQTLHAVVNEADDSNNDAIYYDNYNGKRSIVIREIPSLAMKLGSDFNTNGMQCKLRGLAERYKDDEGNSFVNVLTTHDLNSATIKDISELLYAMSCKK
jgi:hypothetical protein